MARLRSPDAPDIGGEWLDVNSHVDKIGREMGNATRLGAVLGALFHTGQTKRSSVGKQIVQSTITIAVQNAGY